MKTNVFLFWALILACFQTAVSGQITKPRVIAMTDGEVDDRCSMVRFLLYTNDIELEAIIQTNSVYQPKGWSSSKWLDEQIDAYEQVYPNLIVHDPSFPSPAEIRRKVYTGDEDSSHINVDGISYRRIPGTAPVINPAGWKDTPGSDRIVEILLENDPRPVYIQAWGGGNTAARAFYKLKSQYPKDYQRAVSKVVMYNIWYQDGAGNYIEKYHPEVTMLLSFNFSGTWDYGSMAFTNSFVKDIVKNNHGPLGALYKQSFISEGDSPSFLYSLENGLRSYENPAYGGWGGLFYKVPGFRNVYRDVDKGSYQRWIEYANRDFWSRLEWCVAEKFEDANHKPVIKIMGDLNRTVKSGETVKLAADISDSDPVNKKALMAQYAEVLEQLNIDLDQLIKSTYTPFWWQYKEAGTYDGMIQITDTYKNTIQFVAPNVKEPKTIHLILEVKDQGVPALTAFARFIITVLPTDNH